MSEKRLLNLICIEGLLLTILGLCVLILPKLTSITFGVMLSSAFITYGIYKIITTFINKNYVSNMTWCLVMGIYILTVGILLLFVPKISLLWLMSLIGVYFLLESISNTVFLTKIRSMFNYVSCKGIMPIILFIFGFTIVLGLPLMSFWIVALLSGVAFLIKGMTKITLALVNKSNYNM